LVTGSRDLVTDIWHWLKWDKAVKALIGKGFEVVHGAARGVDSIAGSFYSHEGRTVHTLSVTSEEWEKHGKAAGQIRNMRMIRGECACHEKWNKPSLVLAVSKDLDFSPGTRGCVFNANRAGVPVLLVSPD